MAEIVIMPRQGQSVESCVVTKWHKAEGSEVKKGEVLFSYETDKAAFDEEAKVEGTLLKILHAEGDDVPCLEAVAVVGKAGEDISSLLAGGTDQPREETKAEAKTVQPVKEVQNEPIVSVQTSGDVFISPRAKNAAAEKKIDYTQAIPTGPNGRIIERDILQLEKDGVGRLTAAAYSAGIGGSEGSAIGGKVGIGDTPIAASTVQPAGEYTDVPLPNIRKIIAKAMHTSLSELAQLTLHSSFDATSVLDFRAQVKEAGAKMGLPNITLNDIILYAVSRVLKNHKDANAHFLGDRMRYFSGVHLGMAVDTPRGLLVPTLFNADKMSLIEISKEAKKLAEEAQSGRIAPEKLTGGTFTITNLGTLGVEMFTPVINPPQTAILGVNTLIDRVREKNGRIETYKAMGLSLTFDHRALDGAPAARCLKDICDALQNFAPMLLT